MKNHTPGIWAVKESAPNKFQVVSDYGTAIVENVMGLPADSRAHAIAEAHDNALLIAAAPKMRELLVDLHRELSMMAEAADDPSDWEAHALHRIESLLWPKEEDGNVK